MSFFRLVVDAVVWFIRVLFASRISLISVLAGLWLFWQVDQAQNLLADTSWNSNVWISILYWLVFYLATTLIWAFPVHYAARRVLDDDAWMMTRRVRAAMSPGAFRRFCDDARHRHEITMLYVPRLLGLVPFAAIGLGLHGAAQSMAQATLPEADQARAMIRMLELADSVAALLFYLMVMTRRTWTQAFARRLNRAGLLRGGRGTFGDRMLGVAETASLLFSLGLVIVAYLAPVWISVWVPRAALVPFVLGTLVLPFGLPVVAACAGLCLLVTGLNVHFNDLRVLRGGSPWPVETRQMDLDQAVARWAAANGCAVGDATHPCPPALIVAAEGGASRAAFATATVVGTILDRMAELGDPTALTSPARRIFAMSGVSGGAFGAATIRAALSDAMMNGNALPCHYPDRTWFRSTAHADGTAFGSWKECLQALTSGDYLSTTLIGIAFRDNLAPPLDALGPNWVLADRAALLEQSWERHYDYVVTSGSSRFHPGQPCDDSSEVGLCRRFGYLSQHPALKAHPDAWLPLLLLNGTSVQTGRRIITSDLVPTYASPDGKSRIALYQQAYDLFEAMSTNCRKDQVKDQACLGAAEGGVDRPGLRDGPDLRLSTAALTSARFPVISPAGAIYAKDTEAFGDRIVDGGFFENSGISTALDVANALESRHVVPLILWILNDPERNQPDEVFVPPRAAVTPLMGRADAQGLEARVLGLLAAPISTVINTREGHSSESANTAAIALTAFSKPYEEKPGAAGLASFIKIGVRAAPDLIRPGHPTVAEEIHCGAVWDATKKIDMPEVSMSWWLSYTLQADLDAQLCGMGARDQLQNLVDRLGIRKSFVEANGSSGTGSATGSGAPAGATTRHIWQLPAGHVDPVADAHE